VRPQPQTALAPLLLDPEGPTVVAVGGGHGQAAALEAIQFYAGQISALVTVGDDGGSSGRLSDLGIPPPGDIRRCLLALTPEPSIWSELFTHRFTGADVADHSLGNLILAGLADIFGDFSSAVSTAERMLGTVGSVIPVADTAVTLRAVVGGVEVVGQRAIAEARGGVEELTMEPSDTVASRRALEAIAGAQQIVIGPGSLFTSIISALKVNMISQAVMSADAQKVLVMNLVTQDGETLDMDGPAHLRALEDHVGLSGPGVLVVHDGPLTVPDGHQRISVDPDLAAEYGWRIVSADLADEQADWPEHDPLKLGQVLDKLTTTEN
jgi:uncharacterized cofD-like protein